MAQSGYTPIQLYYSTTAAAVPVNTNLASGELALNIQDEKLYFKNAAGTVKLLASNATSAPVTSFQTSLSGLTPSTATTGAVTLAGTLGTANGGTNLTSFTSGGVVYASSTSALATGSAFTFDGANVIINATTPAYFTGTSNLAQISINRSPSTGTIFNASQSAAFINIDGASGGSSFQFAVASAANTQPSEGMRLNSTGLGIGTSSPAQSLHVKTATSATPITLGVLSNATGLPALSFNGAYASTTMAGIYANGATSTSLYYEVPSENSHFWGIADSTKMTLDSAGNLLVGTTASNYRLNVRGAGSVGDSSVYAQFTTLDTGTANSDGFVIGVGTGSSPNANIIQQENAAMVFFTNATERARISAAGGFSVGTTADPGAGAIYATGNITAFFSDKRLKTVSGKIENALDKVGKLSGVYYTFNDTAKSFGYDSDEEQVGVIAQEVEAVLPQIVKAAPFDLDENNNSKSGENYKTVQYDKLVPLLIEAINELRAEVRALKGE